MSLVSIITPVYNSERYISQCIKSVLSQSYNNWEMILCDDCSTDDSVKVVQEYVERDERIKLIFNETNSGAGVTRNNAIRVSKGRYIAFLDSDDLWHKDKLKKQMDFMIQSNLAMVYSHYYVLQGNDEKPSHVIHAPKKVSFKNMLSNDYIGFLTLIYDTRKLGKQYMPKIRRRQDWAYKLKLLKIQNYAYGIQEPLAYYRVGTNSLSSNKIRLIKYNFTVYYKELGYSFGYSVLLMVNFLTHYFWYKVTSKKKLNSK